METGVCLKQGIRDMEGDRGRIYENLYRRYPQELPTVRFRGAYLLGSHANPNQNIAQVVYFIGSTTTAVPYARTSVTPCMTSVAS